MKWFQVIFFLLFRVAFCFAQEKEPEPLSAIEHQVENQTETNDTETEDDSYFQQLEYYTKHPINLNSADASELRELKILSDLQIQNLFIYRNLLGALISIHELQAIPTWDIVTIKKLLPYIVVSDSKRVIQSLQERLVAGSNSMLLRFSMELARSKGFYQRDTFANFYLGSRPHLLMRYKYNYKSILQYGLLGEKDAGEQFFKGSQKYGFDFYSFHFFTRNLGIVKSLAIGDFTINLGQGLIHWQSLAFKKSAAVVSVKRQSDVVRPYNSSGEYNFHRGAAITLGKKNWETTIFASIRRLTATIKTDSLLVQLQPEYISSISHSGNHRSLSESEHRNNLQLLVVGSNTKYNSSKWNTGISCVQYFYSKPLKVSDKPYDLFGIEGQKWTSFSLDYSYTFRNIHLYGEIAADKNLNLAVLKGIIASLDRKVDVALVYRNVGMRYQSLYGNAFTKNSLPNNENGFYTGISIRPANGWRIDTYADVYQFPWLQYRSDAPGYGFDFLMQATAVPKKQIELSLRYKIVAKEFNGDSSYPTSQIVLTHHSNLRYQISYRVNREILLKNRVEVVGFKNKSGIKENGYLAFLDFHYKSYSKPFSFNTRLLYFETSGFDTRIFAYENDVLFKYSVPAFFDKGFRWYLNIKTEVSHWKFKHKNGLNLVWWIRYASTQYAELNKIGSGMDEIKGKIRNDIRFQLLLSQ